MNPQGKIYTETEACNHQSVETERVNLERNKRKIAYYLQGDHEQLMAGSSTETIEDTRK